MRVMGRKEIVGRMYLNHIKKCDHHMPPAPDSTRLLATPFSRPRFESR